MVIQGRPMLAPLARTSHRAASLGPEAVCRLTGTALNRRSLQEIAWGVPAGPSSTCIDRLTAGRLTSIDSHVAGGVVAKSCFIDDAPLTPISGVQKPLSFALRRCPWNLKKEFAPVG